jgi:hypothetical protein
MRILFFTLIKISSFKEKSIYADMVNEFIKIGHSVDYLFPSEENFNLNVNNNSITSIQLGLKFQKTKDFFRKFLSYKLIEKKVSRKIKESNLVYDLLIISTPSIFQLKIIKIFKKKYPDSRTLLLLKDIFPDNAIDLNLFVNLPFNKHLIQYFHLIEENLYKSVDFIGCMNQSNINYISNKHPYLKTKLFVSHNSIKSYPLELQEIDYTFPKNSLKFVFLGNIGLPQNISSFEVFIKRTKPNIFFLIIGSGTKVNFLKKLEKDYPQKIKVINHLSNRQLIDSYLNIMDAGLVLLNPNFKVPNYPSKLLTYLNAKLPIIAFTDKHNEISDVIKSYNLGYWSDFNDLDKCLSILNNFSFEKSTSKFSEILSIYSIENQVNNILKVINDDSIERGL